MSLNEYTCQAAEGAVSGLIENKTFTPKAYSEPCSEPIDKERRGFITLRVQEIVWAIVQDAPEAGTTDVAWKIEELVLCN